MAEKLQNSQYIDHYTAVDGCGNGMVVVLVVCTGQWSCLPGTGLNTLSNTECPD